MSQFVELSVADGVARLILNRPEKRNALVRAILEDLVAHLDVVQARSEIRVLTLEARGPVFCAGMDLAEMLDRAQLPDASAHWQRDAELYADVVRRLVALDIPTLAIVQGPVVAGGVGLVLACDMVIAARSIFFMLPEPARGITAAIVTPLLLRRVGWATANWLLLSGQRVPADHPSAIGLCNELVELDRLAARAGEVIQTILSGSPQALALTKRHMRSCLRLDVSKLIDASVELSAEARHSPDAREGLTAFLEKRPPAWQPPS